MYTSFRAQNFRCFEDLQLDDLGRINLIAGKNNTGKTSLLEAIMLHSGDEDFTLLLRGQPPGGWHSPFYDFDSTQTIIFSGMFENGDKIVSLEIVSLSQDGISWSRTIPGIGTSTKHGMEIVGPHWTTKPMTNPFEAIPPAVILRANKPVSEFPQPLATSFSDLTRQQKKDMLVDSMRIIEPRLEALELLYISDLPFIHGSISGLSQLVPLDSMGEGMNRVASLVLAIGSASGGVVCIDEIENGLHYAVMTDVWKAIAAAARSFDVQIFATTHSLECISAAHEAFSDDDPYDFRYHRLDRKKTGEIKAVTFDREDLDVAQEANYEVR